MEAHITMFEKLCVQILKSFNVLLITRIKVKMSENVMSNNSIQLLKYAIPLYSCTVYSCVSQNLDGDRWSIIDPPHRCMGHTAWVTEWRARRSKSSRPEEPPTRSRSRGRESPETFVCYKNGGANLLVLSGLTHCYTLMRKTHSGEKPTSYHPFLHSLDIGWIENDIKGRLQKKTGLCGENS